MRTHIRASAALGFMNVARVLSYRAGLRLRVHPVLRAKSTLPTGPFFSAIPAHLQRVPAEETFTPLLFGWLQLPLSHTPPDWHLNQLSGKHADATSRNWYQIPDFDPA